MVFKMSNFSYYAYSVRIIITAVIQYNYAVKEPPRRDNRSDTCIPLQCTSLSCSHSRSDSDNIPVVTQTPVEKGFLWTPTEN